METGTAQRGVWKPGQTNSLVKRDTFFTKLQSIEIKHHWKCWILLFVLKLRLTVLPTLVLAQQLCFSETQITGTCVGAAGRCLFACKVQINLHYLMELILKIVNLTTNAYPYFFSSYTSCPLISSLLVHVIGAETPLFLVSVSFDIAWLTWSLTVSTYSWHEKSDGVQKMWNSHSPVMQVLQVSLSTLILHSAQDLFLCISLHWYIKCFFCFLIDWLWDVETNLSWLETCINHTIMQTIWQT